MTTLLQRWTEEKRLRAEDLRSTVRQDLADALREILPGVSVYVFGSLVHAGRFHDESDVDIALEEAPETMSVEQLIARLAERLARPVDVALLAECRFKDTVMHEGERWTPSA